MEHDPRTAQLAAQGSWPAFTDLRRGDALAVLRESGGFDLIFADAQGGNMRALISRSPPSIPAACSSSTT
jgi:hypothetical protein